MSKLKPAAGARSKTKRLGRGNGSGKGTTAGRGTKGQGARTGGRNRRDLRGFRHIMLATPKLRGFRSLQPKAAVVTLLAVATAFSGGQEVTIAALIKKGLLAAGEQQVKIIGSTKLDKKLIISGCAVTAGARQAVEAAGGQIK